MVWEPSWTKSECSPQGHGYIPDRPEIKTVSECPEDTYLEEDMSDIPEQLRYTPDHEWIYMEDDFIGRCGITDYAQEMLTDIVFVELPEIGFEIKKGDPVAVVESMKSVSDVFAPVTGRITAVNTALEDSPGLINSSPYDKGWIFRIEVKSSYEIDELMDAEGYQEYLESGDSL